MAHVTVTIAGRAYRMACGDGEEQHLQTLADIVDAKIIELKGAFGEIGDQRITVMASLTFADELSEARRRIGVLEAECEDLRRAHDAAAVQVDDRDHQVAQSLAHAAGRIEQICHTLGATATTKEGPSSAREGGPAE